MVLEKTLERPLDCKKIQPVHPKGDQSWDFFGRNDANMEGIKLAMKQTKQMSEATVGTYPRYTGKQMPWPTDSGCT